MHSEGVPVFLLQLHILVLFSDNVILHHNTGIFHPSAETNNWRSLACRDINDLSTSMRHTRILREGRRLKLSKFSRYIKFLISNSQYPTGFFCFLTRPAGSSKYDTTHKNFQRYYTPKRVIRYISPSDLCNDRSAQRRTGIGCFINPLIFVAYCLLMEAKPLCCPVEWVSVTIENERPTNSADFDPIPIFPDLSFCLFRNIVGF